jgi:hypothetical protein
MRKLFVFSILALSSTCGVSVLNAASSDIPYPKPTSGQFPKATVLNAASSDIPYPKPTSGQFPKATNLPGQGTHHPIAIGGKRTARQVF